MQVQGASSTSVGPLPGNWLVAHVAAYNLNALQPIILLIMEANTMTPDQTAP